jgi:nitrogen regulatory protein P-II 1
MKKVAAVIRPSSLHRVVEALDRLDVGGATVSETAPSGDAPRLQRYRSATYVVDAIPSLRVEVVSSDAYAGPIAWAIATAARTGDPGDGVVSVETVEEAVRIRTGERGIAAVSAGLDLADAPQRATVPRPAPPTMEPSLSEWTKVLLTNVVLAPALLVLFFHAPPGYTALGAGTAGLLLWARERSRRAR